MSNVIESFFKNSAETDKLIVSINEWRGQEYIDIRWYFKPDGQEDFFPSKKGISLSIHHLDKLKASLGEATKLVNGGQVCK